MTAPYQELAGRIRAELVDLETVVQRALRVWAQLQTHPAEQDVYLDSVALNLHGFYSGVERLFVLIGQQVDGALPDGAAWHRALLEQMAREVVQQRPAVIAPDTLAALDEFRRFRHIVRNVYAVNLTPHKMAGLLRVLPELWPAVQAELAAFADFLEAAAYYFSTQMEAAFND